MIPFRVVAASVLALGLAAAPAAAETPAYGVTVKTARKAEIAKLKTYSWGTNHAAIDKTVDAQIVAAIERELAGAGLTKATQGAGDALVAYHTIVRRDVDTKKTAPVDVPGYLVGVIAVDVRAASSKAELFNARIDHPINAERAKLGPAIDEAVKALFQRYPHEPPAR